jgi:hypothetical protein
VFAVGLPLVGLAVLAMMLSDEAVWAQALGAVALLAFLALVARAHLASDRKLVEAGELPGWLVGPWRYALIAIGIVIVYILERS